MADTFTVTRSRTMPGAPGEVFALIDDFRQWQQWSPWEDLDPDLERRYSGAESGVGAVYEWSGNKKAGQGRMEITESVPPGALPGKVVVALDFLKPFKSSNTTTFDVEPADGGTKVTWTMVGPRPLMMRLLGFAFNPEKMVGPDFEKGLDRIADATG